MDELDLVKFGFGWPGPGQLWSKIIVSWTIMTLDESVLDNYDLGWNCLGRIWPWTKLARTKVAWMSKGGRDASGWVVRDPYFTTKEAGLSAYSLETSTVTKIVDSDVRWIGARGTCTKSGMNNIQLRAPMFFSYATRPLVNWSARISRPIAAIDSLPLHCCWSCARVSWGRNFWGLRREQ